MAVEREGGKVTGGATAEERGGKKAKAGGKTNGSGSGGGKAMEQTKKNGELKALLTLMLKTQLRSEQRHREMEAIQFETFIGPADSLFLNQLTK